MYEEVMVLYEMCWRSLMRMRGRISIYEPATDDPRNPSVSLVDMALKLRDP